MGGHQVAHQVQLGGGGQAGQDLLEDVDGGRVALQGASGAPTGKESTAVKGRPGGAASLLRLEPRGRRRGRSSQQRNSQLNQRSAAQCSAAHLALPAAEEAAQQHDVLALGGGTGARAPLPPAAAAVLASRI